MDSGSVATLESPSILSSASRTESSKSTGSFKEREEEFTRDNVASPVDLECHIQAERIMKMVDEMLYKIKLSICLPTLVQEKNTLSSTMIKSHYDDVMFIFEQYDDPLFSTSLLNVSAIDDVKNGDLSMKNRLNPELAYLIYIINSYPALKSLVEETINQMKSAYNSYQTVPPQPAIEYLLVMEQFRELLLRQMSMTAADELTAKLHTSKMEASRARLIEKIKEIKSTISEEKEIFEKILAGKAAVIAELEREHSMLEQNAAIKLKKQILDSERQMVLKSRSHAVKLELIVEEEQETRGNYQKVLRTHLVEEKNQRARRYKCETQLQSWLQKYDVEMAEKQVELDKFVEMYEEEHEKVKVLEEKIAIQDKEYLPLMEERETEYRQEMVEKERLFKIEHAARIIQVAWKDVLANRAEKRKLKKLQKKMREEIARAEAKSRKKK